MTRANIFHAFVVLFEQAALDKFRHKFRLALDAIYEIASKEKIVFVVDEYPDSTRSLTERASDFNFFVYV